MSWSYQKPFCLSLIDFLFFARVSPQREIIFSQQRTESSLSFQICTLYLLISLDSFSFSQRTSRISQWNEKFKRRDHIDGAMYSFSLWRGLHTWWWPEKMFTFRIARFSYWRGSKPAKHPRRAETVQCNSFLILKGCSLTEVSLECHLTQRCAEKKISIELDLLIESSLQVFLWILSLVFSSAKNFFFSFLVAHL